MSTLRAVCFDIDGTLYAKRELHLHLAFQAFPSPRLAYHYSRFRTLVRSNPERYPSTDYRSKQATFMLQSMGKEVTAEAIEKMKGLIKKQFYDPWEHLRVKLHPYQNLRPTFEYLKEHNLKIGVLSDLPIGKKLYQLGIVDLVDFSLCAETSGFLKPHPLPFELIAAKLQVKPEEIFYVGDSYSKDICGAVGVGMQAALIRNWPLPKDKKRYPLAKFVFRDYDEFIVQLNNVLSLKVLSQR